jgi:hypothetical protein
MLHVFSTNRVKLVAQKPETTLKPGQREYVEKNIKSRYHLVPMILVHVNVVYYTVLVDVSVEVHVILIV